MKFILSQTLEGEIMKIFKQIKNIIIPISAISFIFISHENIEAKVIGKFAHGAASTSEYGKTITEFANRVNSRTNTLFFLR